MEVLFDKLYDGPDVTFPYIALFFTHTGDPASLACGNMCIQVKCTHLYRNSLYKNVTSGPSYICEIIWISIWRSFTKSFLKSSQKWNIRDNFGDQKEFNGPSPKLLYRNDLRDISDIIPENDSENVLSCFRTRYKLYKLS